MKEKGMLNPKDFLAIVIIIVGMTGTLLWGIGYSSIGNPTVQWLGISLLALLGFIVAFLSRWIT